MTTAPTDVIGDLEPGNAVGVRPCIPANEVRIGDTLFAAGYPRGDRRKVLEVVFAPGPTGRCLYVRVAEGWFRWSLIYAHVAAF